MSFLNRNTVCCLHNRVHTLLNRNLVSNINGIIADPVSITVVEKRLFHIINGGRAATLKDNRISTDVDFPPFRVCSIGVVSYLWPTEKKDKHVLPIIFGVRF